MSFPIQGGSPYYGGNSNQPYNPFTLPRGFNQQTGGTSNAGNGYQPYTKRSTYDQVLRNNRKTEEEMRPEQLEKQLELLQTRKGEVDSLTFQLQNTQDPAMKKLLQGQLDETNAGFHDLQALVDQHYKGLTSGFVGTENRLDHIGSFVTMV